MTLTELKALAETATPGTWEWTQRGLYAGNTPVLVPDNEYGSDLTIKSRAADDAFIAAANPRVVAAMIEIIQALDEYIRPTRAGYAYENRQSMINARAVLDAALKEAGDV